MDMLMDLLNLFRRQQISPKSSFAPPAPIRRGIVVTGFAEYAIDVFHSIVKAEEASNLYPDRKKIWFIPSDFLLGISELEDLPAYKSIGGSVKGSALVHLALRRLDAENDAKNDFLRPYLGLLLDSRYDSPGTLSQIASRLTDIDHLLSILHDMRSSDNEIGSAFRILNQLPSWRGRYLDEPPPRSLKKECTKAREGLDSLSEWVDRYLEHESDENFDAWTPELSTSAVVRYSPRDPYQLLLLFIKLSSLSSQGVEVDLFFLGSEQTNSHSKRDIQSLAVQRHLNKTATSKLDVLNLRLFAFWPEALSASDSSLLPWLIRSTDSYMGPESEVAKVFKEVFKGDINAINPIDEREAWIIDRKFYFTATTD